MSNKYENSFSDLWEKNNGFRDAIDSVSKIINKTEQQLVIYAEDLKDNLYADLTIMQNMEKILNDGKKITIYWTRKSGMTIDTIINYFTKKYPNNFKSIKTASSSLDIDFAIADDKYIRVEFDKVMYRARYIVEDSIVKSTIAKKWIIRLNEELKRIIA